MIPVRAVPIALSLLLAGAALAGAEPMFLSKQYARCSTCHYSATGGGLLTPYGRSLSGKELSTTGAPQQGTLGTDTPAGEEAFLWGAFGNRLGPLQLGIDMRPSHLSTSFAGFSSDRNFLMNADLLMRTAGAAPRRAVGSRLRSSRK